jgi:two-component system OmpR family response regulator
MRHVLFVEESGPSRKTSVSSSMHRAIPLGWRVTRVEEGELALFWLRHTPPDLVLVGRQLADHSPTRLVRSIRCDHESSLLPLVQVGGPTDELCAEPDAWLDPEVPGAVEAAFCKALAARAERLREGTRAEMRLLLPSDLDHLDELAHLFGPWFTAAGFGPQWCQQLSLAVRELAANSIEWGHRLDRSRSVWVHARLDDEKVSVLVRDSGPGFDPTDLPHAARPGDPLSHLAVRSSLQLREGGFGILMTRGLVDLLCYNDTGNEAQLIKYLPLRKAVVSLEVGVGKKKRRLTILPFPTAYCLLTTAFHLDDDGGDVVELRGVLAEGPHGVEQVVHDLRRVGPAVDTGDLQDALVPERLSQRIARLDDSIGQQHHQIARLQR